MFQNIGRKLASLALHVTARASIQLAQVAPAKELSQRELTFFGRGKGGKVTHKRGNAAQLKRVSTKANNIRKFN